MNRKRYIAVVIFLVVFFVGMYFWKGGKRYYMSAGVVWTTEYHVTYESDRQLDDSIQSVLARVDMSASKYNKNSLLTKINDNKTTAADDILVRLYEKSGEVYRASGGAFDPTVSPLANVWGFGLNSGLTPDDATIDSIKAFVGFDKTKMVNGSIVKADNRTTFDFNSIAKGLACDEVGRMLARNGVENYIVEIGGEIAVQGHNDNGEKWRISVDKPIESADTVIHKSAFVVELGSGGVATSGNYRNFKIVGGKKVAHTINPHTGKPEMTNLLSVTIVANDCMTADAYATACMALGVDGSKRMLGCNSDIAVSLSYIGEDVAKIEVWENPAFAVIKKLK